jgi:hypothetical protein
MCPTHLSALPAALFTLKYLREIDSVFVAELADDNLDISYEIIPSLVCSPLNLFILHEKS